MCGGRGTRLDSSHEKPLHPVADAPMVDAVVDALEASRIETTFVAVSPNVPETRDHLADRGDVAVLDTPGDGYVADLGVALEDDAVSAPILTAAADLPLLDGATVDRTLNRYERRSSDRGTSAGHGTSASHGASASSDGRPSMTVCVPRALKRRLGVSLEGGDGSESPLVPAGVNVVGESTEDVRAISYDPRLAVNVNRWTDAELADRLARRRFR